MVDENTYKGRIAVRLGPVALTFAGVIEFEERDNATHTARVKAQGTDAKGRGGANATASFRLEPMPNGSKVLVHTNLTLSGSVAQYGRGVGMIQATASALMKQFADCLKKELADSDATTVATVPSPASTAPDTLLPRVHAAAAPPSAANSGEADLRLFIDGAGVVGTDRAVVHATVALPGRTSMILLDEDDAGYL